MKDKIHPPMHAKAKITCTTCGSIYLIPSTSPEMRVEVCRLCHPVYTGKKQAELKGGRVERFRRRQAAGKRSKE